MADIKEESINREKQRFIKQYLDDFAGPASGGDSACILLKGHLLIEHYLDHAIVLILDRKANIKNKSFYNKVLQLKDVNCFADHETAIACLLALNEIRYDLAHQPDFQLSFTQIDAIGYHLGREYILRRYAPDADEKKILLWILGQVAYMVYHPIWVETTQNYQKKSPVMGNGSSDQELSSGTIKVTGMN